MMVGNAHAFNRYLVVRSLAQDAESFLSQTAQASSTTTEAVPARMTDQHSDSDCVAVAAAFEHAFQLLPARRRSQSVSSKLWSASLGLSPCIVRGTVCRLV